MGVVEVMVAHPKTPHPHSPHFTAQNLGRSLTSAPPHCTVRAHPPVFFRDRFAVSATTWTTTTTARALGRQGASSACRRSLVSRNGTPTRRSMAWN